MPGVRLDLLPQPRHVNIHRARRWQGVVAPHFVEQLFPRQRRSAVVDEMQRIGGGASAAQNLLNHVNPVGFSGVMTSPFFGRPTTAMPGRRIDLGLHVGF